MTLLSISYPILIPSNMCCSDFTACIKKQHDKRGEYDTVTNNCHHFVNRSIQECIKAGNIYSCIFSWIT